MDHHANSAAPLPLLNGFTGWAAQRRALPPEISGIARRHDHERESDCACQLEAKNKTGAQGRLLAGDSDLRHLAAQKVLYK